MALIALAILASYLIGSIPTAYVFVRLLKNADIRTYGSGNVGATNAARVIGKGWGVTVLLLDVLKGMLPVIFLGDALLKYAAGYSPEQLRVAIGLGCIAGHNWTVFLKFKGGKGIATTFGVLIGLALRIPGLHLVLGFSILTWLLVFLPFRIVSLSSLAAAITLPVYAVIFKQTRFLIISTLILSVFAFIRHRQNILRLLNKTEPRFKF